MNTRARTLVWTLTAALLLGTGAMAAEAAAGWPQPEPGAEPAGEACEWFYYSADPPGYQLDPSCITPALRQ